VIDPARLDLLDQGAEGVFVVGQWVVLTSGDGDVGVAFSVIAYVEAVRAFSAEGFFRAMSAMVTIRGVGERCRA
jgi:hypothetical protein